MGTDEGLGTPEAVSAEWFLANVERKFHGCETHTHPLQLNSTIAELFPALWFIRCEVHKGGKVVEGTWAVARGVLIQERELPSPHRQKFCVCFVWPV